MKRNRPYAAVWTASIMTLIAATICFGLYRSHFPGPFAISSSEWSDFGAYFGGVLTPLFAAVGFIAVIYQIIKGNREAARAGSVSVMSNVEKEIDDQLKATIRVPNTIEAEQNKTLRDVMQYKYPSEAKIETYYGTPIEMNHELWQLRIRLLLILRELRTIDDAAIADYYKLKYSDIVYLVSNEAFHFAKIAIAQDPKPETTRKEIAVLETFYNIAAKLKPIEFKVHVWRAL